MGDILKGYSFHPHEFAPTSMAPQPWAMPEQQDFLRKEDAEWALTKAGPGHLKGFYTRTAIAFLKRWLMSPSEKILEAVGGDEVEAARLVEWEMTHMSHSSPFSLSALLSLIPQRMSNWYSNLHCPRKASPTTSEAMLNLSGKTSRKKPPLQKWQAFSVIYYCPTNSPLHHEVEALFDQRHDPSAVGYLTKFLPQDVDMKTVEHLQFLLAFMRERCTRLSSGEEAKVVSRSKAWQNKIYQICQEIPDIKQQTRNEEKHVLNKGTPKIYYRGKTVSLDTHGENATGGIYSAYSTPLVTELSHNSGTLEHYDTPIFGASPVPPSRSPMPGVPHTPLLIPGSRISEPSSDVGLGRACNADLSQSPSSCVNNPGESDLCIEEGVATRGESSWLERRETREGQEEGGDPDLGPDEGSSSPSGDLGPSSPPPPNDRKEVTRC